MLARLLLASTMPAVVNMAKRLYELRRDAQTCEMGLFTYTCELVRGPLGLSAPFSTWLRQREEIHYESLGPLNPQQQDQIFQAIGRGNKTLTSISFDESNQLNLRQLACTVRA